MAEVVLVLRLPDDEAQTLLLDVEAHHNRDEVDGHRDHGVIMINTMHIVSVTRREED
jgi:hypothetical protein